ncbi:helix-turn-helix domain-containing protein [Maritimibacter alkaliphilus]|uniref:helix-turn-helix domain-containing protein n=1 Tax=Maritimibacter alkaliphilus TaxID=404236 RepID=UPI001C986B9D|nr:XRE family transcriptional regulator [Maritimibacter alkaliphilus]MBY6092638.1 XRE family transcriptional regulator [Maritimibacter alkaliphilus]
MTKTLQLGPRIRRLRKTRQLTLAQLAEVSGVSIATISKIENGTLSPTLDKLLRIAEGLDQTVGQLLGEDRPPANETLPNSRLQVARAQDGVKIDTPNYAYNYLCSEISVKRLVPIRARVKAHSIEDFGELERHGGEEFIFVLEGAIEVHTEFYAPISLAKGEGVFLDSSMGHAYVNKTSEDADVICVCTEQRTVEDAT